MVPAHVEPPRPKSQKEFEHAPEMTADLREVIEPDIFITGDANLLIEPEEKRDARWDLVTRTLSVLVHVGLIIFLIFIPKIFPPHVPTQEETEMARQQLTYLLPPEAARAADASRAQTAHHPENLESCAPPVEPPAPASADTGSRRRHPNRPPELPEAPRPQRSRSATPASADAARAFATRTREAGAAATQSAEPGDAVRQRLHDQIAGSNPAQQPGRRDSGSAQRGYSERASGPGGPGMQPRRYRF